MVRVNSVVVIAVPLGIGIGLGLWILVSLVPQLAAPRLARRLAPYLVDISAEARVIRDGLAAEPGSVVVGLISPLVARVRRGIALVLGGDDAVERRLRQAGSVMSVDGFRSRQLVWAACGLAAGIALAIVWSRSTPVPVPVVIAAVVVAGAAGMLAPEQLLAQAARRRQARIAAELPTVLELLSLALAAGEGVLDAVRRVGRVGAGELSHELGRVGADVNTGVPLPEALARCARTLDLPAVTRAVDQLVAALERGSPLADVLRSHAADVRGEARRALIEAAGRKEVAMLVPLVFLILPVTIAFALAPGVMVLQLGF